MIKISWVINLGLELKIQRNKEIPIYRQIMEQIISNIKNGKLKAGTKLPPERELASELDTSRGTVAKAYRELEHMKVIEVIQGSGSFISKEQDVIDESRKEKAIKLINNTMDSLEELEFTSREIRIFIDIMMLEREKGSKNITIATIDCNPEALNIFKLQLEYIKNVSITRFLLDDLKKANNLNTRLNDYDVIITTSTHYSEVLSLVPNLFDKIVKAAVSPSQQTIINCAKITQKQKIGIMCYSKRFHNIIKDTLKGFVNLENVGYIYEVPGEKRSIKKFLEGKNIIILPSDSDIKNTYMHEFQEFEKDNGIIMKFEYQIERGTLIYIEERIRELMNKKG
jgi:DNA-binding transcriptional regulator YhcF (GntR family)